MCDNCKDSADHAREMRNFTTEAADALRLVQSIVDRGDKVTQVLAMAAFKGSNTREMRDRRYDTLEHFGKGASVGHTQSERLFDTLLHEHALEYDPVKNGAGWTTNYLKVHMSTASSPAKDSSPCRWVTAASWTLS